MPQSKSAKPVLRKKDKESAGVGMNKSFLESTPQDNYKSKKSSPVCCLKWNLRYSSR